MKQEHIGRAILRSLRTSLIVVAVVGALGWIAIDWCWKNVKITKDTRYAKGTITGMTLDSAEDDRGRGGYFYIVRYEFRTPSGDVYDGTDTEPDSTSLEVGGPIEVEYSHSDPATNRERAEPRSAFFAWAYLIVAIGLLAWALVHLARDFLKDVAQIKWKVDFERRMEERLQSESEPPS